MANDCGSTRLVFARPQLRPRDITKVQQHDGRVTGINNAATVKVSKRWIHFAVLQQQNAEVAGVNNAAQVQVALVVLTLVRVRVGVIVWRAIVNVA